METRSIMKFYNIFFSPTGGTKKVADIIIDGTKQEAEVIDLIKEPDKIKRYNLKKMMCVWLVYLLMEDAFRQL